MLVVRRQNFGNSRHAHGIGAKTAKHPVFGRGFQTRSRQANIDALLKAKIHIQGDVFSKFQVAAIVNLKHIGKTVAPLLVVGADERIAGEEIDMIFD